MNANSFAIGVLRRMQSQKPREYADVIEWRAAWFDALLEYFRSLYVAGSDPIADTRQEVAEFQRRIEIGNEYPGVMHSLKYHLREDAPTLEFWERLWRYFAARSKDDQRDAARAIAAFAEASVGFPRWRAVFDYLPQHDETNQGEYVQVLRADRFVGNDHERHAGAFAVRFRRIADKGSATPLDSEEADWLLVLELRYEHRCALANFEKWHTRNDYRPMHMRLYHSKRIAQIDALDHLRAAEQIGDTAGTEAAHADFAAADALFGGNVDDDGNLIWQSKLDDDQRRKWEAWKATQP